MKTKWNEKRKKKKHQEGNRIARFEFGEVIESQEGSEYNIWKSGYLRAKYTPTYFGRSVGWLFYFQAITKLALSFCSIYCMFVCIFKSHIHVFFHSVTCCCKLNAFLFRMNFLLLGVASQLRNELCQNVIGVYLSRYFDEVFWLFIRTKTTDTVVFWSNNYFH